MSFSPPVVVVAAAVVRSFPPSLLLLFSSGWCWWCADDVAVAVAVYAGGGCKGCGLVLPPGVTEAWYEGGALGPGGGSGSALISPVVVDIWQYGQ